MQMILTFLCVLMKLNNFIKFVDFQMYFSFLYDPRFTITVVPIAPVSEVQILCVALMVIKEMKLK